jgi:LysM repeat protein
MKQWIGIVIGGGVLMFSISGCGVTKDVTVRSYLQDRPRVDQNREVGNSGYIMGNPVDEDAEYKKTRKVYVIEVNRENQITDTVIDVDEDFQSSSPAREESRDRPTETIPESRRVTREERIESVRRLELPKFDDEAYYKETASATVQEPLRFEDYTIEKNDTLQKISKKFYDSFSQWPKIYDANRNKIDNPNVLRPGVVIRIPIYQ